MELCDVSPCQNEGDSVHLRDHGHSASGAGAREQRLANGDRMAPGSFLPLHRRACASSAALQRQSLWARLLWRTRRHLHQSRRRSVHRRSCDRRDGDPLDGNRPPNFRSPDQIQVLSDSRLRHDIITYLRPACPRHLSCVLRRRTQPRKSNRVGIRLGLRSRLGRCHFPLWRGRPSTLRQRERGDLLQGAKSRRCLVRSAPARPCAVAKRQGAPRQPTTTSGPTTTELAHFKAILFLLVGF